jgi:hypothetical protein
MSRIALGSTESSVQRVPVFIPGVKRRGHEVNHSLPSVSKVKNNWNYTSSPNVCLSAVEKENFTF